MMESHPLEQLTLEEAIEMQFRLVDVIQSVFSGEELVSGGDYGVVPGLGRPRATAKVEEVLARFLGTEDAALVRGAGSGALRLALWALVRPGGTILVHDAPVYSTTEFTLRFMNLEVTRVNMNALEDLRDAVASNPDAVLVQRTRQKMSDRYEFPQVIGAIRQVSRVPIITDENYAVMRVPALGAVMGADASAFSLFKLLGPEGIGCVAGRREVIEKIREFSYSGGSQVQGPEAMEAMRSMVRVPVAHAIQAQVTDEVARRLNAGEVEGVKSACVANAQSRVALVELREPVAREVLEASEKLGAVPYPVGAESRYEVGAMFYRVSASFLESSPEMRDYMIRINPMWASAGTVMRILREALRGIR